MNKFYRCHCPWINWIDTKLKPAYTYLRNLIFKASSRVLFFSVRQLDIYFTLHHLLLWSPQSKSCCEWFSYGVNHWHFWWPQKCYEFICIAAPVVWKWLFAICQYFHRWLVILGALLKLDIYLQYYTFPSVFCRLSNDTISIKFYSLTILSFLRVWILFKALTSSCTQYNVNNVYSFLISRI